MEPESKCHACGCVLGTCEIWVIRGMQREIYCAGCNEKRLERKLGEDAK